MHKFEVGDRVCLKDDSLINLRVVNIEDKEVIHIVTKEKQVETRVTVYSVQDDPYVFPAEELKIDNFNNLRFRQNNSKCIDAIPF